MRSFSSLCLVALVALPAVGAFSSLYQNGKSIDKNLDNIIYQNAQWRAEKEAKDPNYFANKGSGHSPEYLWIGCSDARVPANEIMGEDVGSVFVVRNVANLVVNTDFNLMSALQYAVDYLSIPHIIVCGHYDCGGVRASIEAKDHVPPLENWLRNIRDVYRLHKDELNAILDPEARHRRLVELNVIEQCMNLFKTGVVQRHRVKNFNEGRPYTTPRVHAMVFDPKTGEMVKLPVRISQVAVQNYLAIRRCRLTHSSWPTNVQINFREYIEDIHDIYDLYAVDSPKVYAATEPQGSMAAEPANHIVTESGGHTVDRSGDWTFDLQRWKKTQNNEHGMPHETNGHSVFQYERNVEALIESSDREVTNFNEVETATDEHDKNRSKRKSKRQRIKKAYGKLKQKMF